MNQTNESQVLLVTENARLDIEFELSVFDGPLIEKTAEGEVFSFQIGDGQLLPQLESLLIGLEVDTTAKFTLVPEQAFGRSDPNNFQIMPKSDFPVDMVLNLGHVIGFDTPTGDEIPGTIMAVSDNDVTINFNHPLADKVIVFSATIKAIY